MTLPPEVRGRLGPLAHAAETVLGELATRAAVARLLDGDHTLWRDDPTELADRLGWVPVVDEVRSHLPELAARCAPLVQDVDQVLVMGMGGSSLFPEVLARTFGRPAGAPALHVLDTTDPAAIARIAASCPPQRTLHLASSKSGSTIETRSHLEWAWARSGDPRRFAVVTDPGSELGDLARERGFAEVFENRPDLGGRYSALSLFGIVPALLAGLDAGTLLDGGRRALAALRSTSAEPGPALELAAVLAAGVRSGRDKLTVVLPAAAASFGIWLEQLVAESLGKDGTGVVPIVDEPIGAPGVYGQDRVFLVEASCTEAVAPLLDAGHPVLTFDLQAELGSIGAAVVVTEVATALAGAALGVQPFDQPDVEAAKVAARALLAGSLEPVPDTPLAEILAGVRPGDHVAIQAFVDPGGPDAAVLAAARRRLRDELHVATSLGFGPRFLHSTGQLHKGGPRAIVCLQVVGEDRDEVAIPGQAFGFGHLKHAQAAGDLATLRQRGLRAGRVSLEELCGPI